jgi:flagellar assembly protein FliH
MPATTNPDERATSTMTIPLRARDITSFDAPALPPLAAFRDRAAEAAERSERFRDDGYAAGYQAGLDAATATIEREIAEHRRAADRLAHAAAALDAAAGEIRARDALALDDLAREAMSIGVEIATELVGRELRSTEQPVLDAIRRAVTLLPQRGTPVVRVHPDDLATATDALAAGIRSRSAETEVVPDPTVERGGCVVDVGDCRIDAQISPAVDRLRATVRDEAGRP